MADCLVCCSPLDPDEAAGFEPCSCRWRLCTFCFHQLCVLAAKEGSRPKCPGCRVPYATTELAQLAPPPKAVPGPGGDAGGKKRRERKGDTAGEAATAGTAPKPGGGGGEKDRRHLASLRVVQRNLVYVVGLTMGVCREELLKRPSHLGRFGKIVKVSVNRGGAYANGGRDGSAPTGSAYVTFSRPEEALRCIEAVDGTELDGRVLRACLGTTKYCHAFLRYQPCGNADCLYLHSVGNEEDSFTKEEMQRSDFTSATVTAAVAPPVGAAAPAPAPAAPPAPSSKAPQTQAPPKPAPAAPPAPSSKAPQTQAPPKPAPGQQAQAQQRPQAGQRGMAPPAPAQSAQPQRAWQVPQHPAEAVPAQALPPPPMAPGGRLPMGGHAPGDMYGAHLAMPPQPVGVSAPAAIMSSWGWNGFQAAAAVVQPQQQLQQQQQQLLREQELREQELVNSARSRYGFAHSFEADMLAYGAAMGQQALYGNGQAQGLGPPPPGGPHMFLDFNGAAAAQAARAQARAQYEAAVHGLDGLGLGASNGYYSPGDDARLTHLVPPAVHQGNFPPPGVALAPQQQGHSRMQGQLQPAPALPHGGQQQQQQQAGRNGVHHRSGRQGQKMKAQA